MGEPARKLPDAPKTMRELIAEGAERARSDRTLRECLVEHYLISKDCILRMLDIVQYYRARAFVLEWPQIEELATERIVIAHLLCGRIAIEDLSRIDWAPQHYAVIVAYQLCQRVRAEGLVEGLLYYDEVTRLAGSYNSAWAGLTWDFTEAINAVDLDKGCTFELLRLEALTRQRRALRYIEAARRELSSRQCDHGVAEAHIKAAEQCLFSERCTSGSQ